MTNQPLFPELAPPEPPPPHFRVEKLTTPIPVHHNASKQWLRWAIICVVTGGRFAARKTKDQAEQMAGMYGRAACWLCDEAQRKDGCVREVQ